MVASLLKTLTSGLQDYRIYDSNTFYPFLKMWKRTSRFTTRWERIDFANTPSFGTTGHIKLDVKGHLCTRLFFIATMPDIYTPQQTARGTVVSPNEFAGPCFGWTNSLGHALIRSISISIGGEVIDTLDGVMLEVLDEFNTPLEKVTVVNRLIKRADSGFTESTFGNSSNPTLVAVPIPFWFSRGNPLGALPIDAIPYDDVIISITLREFNGLYYTDSRATALQSTSDTGGNLWPISGSGFYQSNPAGIAVPGLAYTGLVSLIPNVSMPSTFNIGECYFMAEYIYLDSTEASKMRTSNYQIPIVQHYAMPIYETQGLPKASIPLHIPNPTRDIYWMAQRTDAYLYNAHFLATRDISGITGSAPWWPDASGLNATIPSFLRPAFALSDSEPVKAMSLMYEGSLVRFRTEAPALYRSVLQSFEQKKSPWVNRYYYNYAFAINNRTAPFTNPLGEANLDKISNINLILEFQPRRGSFNPNDVPSYFVFVFAETYNILKVYGGRAGIMFPY